MGVWRRKKRASDAGAGIRDEPAMVAAVRETVVPEINGIVSSALAEFRRSLVAELAEIRGQIEVLTRPPESEPEPDSHFDRLTRVRPTLSEEELAQLSIDEEYDYWLNLYRGVVNQGPINGELMTVTVLGELRDGSIAWINHERTMCGRTGRIILGDLDPAEDDTFRALVVSHVWGHTLKAVIPGSLERPAELRRSQLLPVGAKIRIEPPETVRGTWKAGLEPGDVVLAHISYEGALPFDFRGHLGKCRPAVFRGWENDYALLQAIYDRQSFVGKRGLGVDLVDSPHVLSKKSVVRKAQFDTHPEHIMSRLGHLGPRDATNLHIPAKEPVRNEPARTSAAAAPTHAVAPAVPPSDVLAAVMRRIAESSRNVSPSTILEAILDVHVDTPELRRQLAGPGVPYSALGSLFARVTEAQKISLPKGRFSERVEAAIVGRAPSVYGVLVRRQDEHQLPVLRLVGEEEALPGEVGDEGHEEPLDRGIDWEASATRKNAVLELPEDYEEPDLIIFDQFSVAILLKDRRLDFGSERRRLSAGGSPRCVLIGADTHAGLVSLHNAARALGWEICVANDRAEQRDVAMLLARESGAEIITLVSRHQDIIADLENSGLEVQLVSSLEE